MPLRLRRGTNLQRTDFTPEEGELIYVTDYATAGVSPLYIGDGVTLGGNEVETGGGGGGLTELSQDTTPELGGNLSLAGFEINGTGDIDITGDITASNNIAANNFIGDLTGDVTGTITGNITGNVTGNVVGNLTGNVVGNVVGDLTGDVVGNLVGDVVGSVFADDSSSTFPIVDAIDGSIRPSKIHASGDLQIIDDSGVITVVELLGTEQNTQLNLLKTSASDLTSNNDQELGLLQFGRRDDVNGTAYTTRLVGTGNYFYIAHNVNGSGGPSNTISIGSGEMAIGKFTPAAELDVVGNGVFTGDVTANTFTGTLVAQDSTVMVDSHSATVHLGNNILSNLSDVSSTAPTAGQVLKWSGSAWAPANDQSGSGAVSANLSGATQANPVVVTTSSAHNLVESQQITITDVVGMTEINGNTYYADVLTSTTFALYSDSGLSTSVDGSGFGAYSSGGIVTGAPASDATTLNGFGSSYYLDWANFTSTPTTIAGYGISDAFDGAFSSLTGTPTTLSGYGITDSPTALTDLGISDGTTGQVLTTNGAGTFSFQDVSGLNSRATVSGTTASIANGADDDVDITGYKGYFLYKIQTDGAAWVRIYTNAAKRTADAGRSEGQDPGADSGVIAEVITTGAQTVVVAPGVIGFNDESPVTNIIPCAVRNKTGSTGTVTVTLTAVEMEV